MRSTTKGRSTRQLPRRLTRRRQRRLHPTNTPTDTPTQTPTDTPTPTPTDTPTPTPTETPTPTPTHTPTPTPTDTPTSTPTDTLTPTPTDTPTPTPTGTPTNKRRPTRQADTDNADGNTDQHANANSNADRHCHTFSNRNACPRRRQTCRRRPRPLRRRAFDGTGTRQLRRLLSASPTARRRRCHCRRSCRRGRLWLRAKAFGRQLTMPRAGDGPSRGRFPFVVGGLLSQRPAGATAIGAALRRGRLNDAELTAAPGVRSRSTSFLLPAIPERGRPALGDPFTHLSWSARARHKPRTLPFYD